MTETAEKRAEPTPEPWMLHDMEHATVVTAKKPGLFIAMCDSASFSEEENIRHATLIAAAPDTAAERDRLKAANGDLAEALEWLRAKLISHASAARQGASKQSDTAVRDIYVAFAEQADGFAENAAAALKAHGPAKEPAPETPLGACEGCGKPPHWCACKESTP